MIAVLAFLAPGLAAEESSSGSAEPAWRPATYRGLTMGKSTRKDMLKVLGKPLSWGPPRDQKPGECDPETWYSYSQSTPFEGQAFLVVKDQTGIVERIDVIPASLTEDQFIDLFGAEFAITRHEASGGDHVLYQSTYGDVVMVEYRSLGIAASMGDGKRIQHVSYVSEPIGSQTPSCTPMSLAGASVPVYPEMPRRLGLQGDVHLRVSTDGEHVTAVTITSEPSAMLGREAVGNVKTWTFKNGHPGYFDVTYSYSLIAGTEVGADVEDAVVQMSFPHEVTVRARRVDCTRRCPASCTVMPHSDD